MHARQGWCQIACNFTGGGCNRLNIFCYYYSIVLVFGGVVPLHVWDYEYRWTVTTVVTLMCWYNIYLEVWWRWLWQKTLSNNTAIECLNEDRMPNRLIVFTLLQEVSFLHNMSVYISSPCLLFHTNIKVLFSAITHNLR